MYGYIAAGVLAALLAVGFISYQKGQEDGRTACIAASATKQDKAAVEADRRDTASSEARSTILDYLATIPAAEKKTHESAAKIRTIYRDVPVPAVCDVRPDGVQKELDEARNRAAAAASPL